RAEHVPNLSFVGYVGEMRISLDAVLLDGLDHLLSAILAGNIIDHDIGAGLTERDRHGLADAGISPGDQSLLSLKRPGVRHGGFWVGCGHLAPPEELLRNRRNLGREIPGRRQLLAT